VAFSLSRRVDLSQLRVVRKNTLATKSGNILQLSIWRKLRMSISLIHRFGLRPLRKTLLVSERDGLHLRAFPSLRQPSFPADTHDEDHRGSPWRSPDIPPESDVVAFAVAPAGRLPALEALVPGSHGAVPGSSGFPLL
jgi:hypothetical protein